MATKKFVRVKVNGRDHEAEIEPRLLLVHFIREVLALTGTHVGCDTTNCGANTVQDLTGLPSRSTVHAPQFVVSQPTCVPVSARTSRMKWTRRSRGSISASWSRPLTLTRTNFFVAITI